MDETSTITVATHILSALAHIHSVHIVHRDVKPGNILLGNGIAKLADFGAARYSIQENLETFIGTPIYIAPEFLDNPRSYTNKVDMFSCGIILLECLTSWTPYSGAEPRDINLSRHTHAQWMYTVVLPQLAEVPDRLKPLLRGLLRKQPEKRWSALKCLEWLSNMIPTSGRPSSIPDSALSTGKRLDVLRLTKRRASAALSEEQYVRARPERPLPSPQGLNIEGNAHSPPGDGPPSELPSTLVPDATPATPPPPSPQVSGRNHGMLLGLSFSRQPPISPSWAPTPDRDEGEFPNSSADNEYSLEASDTELMNDWEGG
jgi:serine/threonine protein kinase